jgi:hypothetical protein
MVPVVMAGLVPAIHADVLGLRAGGFHPLSMLAAHAGVDARDKPGHDGAKRSFAPYFTYLRNSGLRFSPSALTPSRDSSVS